MEYHITGSEQKGYRQTLLEYCARWHQHKSRYVLTHYAAHLADAGQVNDLYSLISKPWMEAKLDAFQSHRPFSEDVALTIAAAEAETPVNWPQLIRGCLIFASLGEISTNVPPEALGVLAQTGDPDLVTRAQGYAALIQDAERQAQAYRLIGEAVLEKGEIEQTKQFMLRALVAAEKANKIQRRTRRPQTRTDVIQILARIGAWSRALASIETMKDESAIAAALCNVVPTLIQGAHNDGLYRALAIAETIEGDMAKGRALSCLASAMAQVGEKDGLERVLAAARTMDDELRWKVPTLSDVSHALIQLGDVTQARTVANQGLAEAEAIEDETQKSSALGSVVRVLGRLADKRGLNRALAAARAMDDDSAKADVLITIGLALAESGEHDVSRQVKDQALAAALAVKVKESKVRALQYVAGYLARAGDTAQAAKVANQARTAAEAIESESEKARALVSIARLLAQTGEQERASEAVSQALSAAESVEDELEKSFRLRDVAATLAWLGMKDELVRTVMAIETMESGRWRADALSNVAQVLTQLGDQNGLDRVFAAMEAIEEQLPRALALSEMALAFHRVGEKPRAVDVANQALAAAKETNLWARKDALVRVAWALVQIGERERAEEVLTQMLQPVIEESSAKWDALSSVAQAMARMNRFDQALAVVAFIKSESANADALVKLVQAVAQVRDNARILESANLALGAVEKMGDGPSKAGSLNEMARTLSQVGERVLAREVVIKAINVEEAMLDELAKDRPAKGKWVSILASELVSTAQISAKIGENDQVTKVANKALVVSETIEDASYKANSISRVAQTLARVGEQRQAYRTAQKALAIASTIGDMYSRAGALCRVIEALVESDEKDQAVDLSNQVLADLSSAELASETDANKRFAALVLRDIAQALVRVRELAQALAAANAIRHKPLKAIALSWMAQTLIQTGEEDAATDVANQALSAATEIQDPRDKVRQLSRVSQVLFQTGQKDSAKEATNQALLAATEIEDKSKKAESLSQVIQSLTQMGNHDRALQVSKTAFTTARFAGRESVFKVLEGASATLANFDQGETLRGVSESINDVDSWLGG